MGLFDDVNGSDLRQTMSSKFNAEGTGKLADYVGMTGTVHGFIFKKTKFGLLTMLACDFEGKQLFVGIPGRFTETFQKLSDAAINKMITVGVPIRDIKEVTIKNGPNAGKTTVVFKLVDDGTPAPMQTDGYVTGGDDLDEMFK